MYSIMIFKDLFTCECMGSKSLLSFRSLSRNPNIWLTLIKAIFVSGLNEIGLLSEGGGWLNAHPTDTDVINERYEASLSLTFHGEVTTNWF